MPDSAADCAVCFDGACPLCRCEIARYGGQRGAAQIHRGILAVERFVDRHYAVQIERLSTHPELGALLEALAAGRRVCPPTALSA